MARRTHEEENKRAGGDFRREGTRRWIERFVKVVYAYKYIYHTRTSRAREERR